MKDFYFNVKMRIQTEITEKKGWGDLLHLEEDVEEKEQTIDECLF